jgi:ABC-2 type transport system ATP-binding protein
MDPTPTPAIALSQVTKTYGDKLACDRLDLTVAPGTIVGFLGPNGAGKTTAMRIIMGLASADSGDVKVLGHRPGTTAALAVSGALIESPSLYPSMTARQHLATIARWSATDDSHIDEVLDHVGLLETGKKRTRSFSLGMKQRLGVATTLLKDPQVLILDEPSNGLDPQGMWDMRELLKKLRSQGKTILLSSHLLGEVEQIVDRVHIINRGQAVFNGTLDEIHANHDNFTDFFMEVTK